MAGLSGLIVIGSINTRHGVDGIKTPKDGQSSTCCCSVCNGLPVKALSVSATRQQQRDFLGCRFKVVGEFKTTPRGWPFKAPSVSIT